MEQNMGVQEIGILPRPTPRGGVGDFFIFVYLYPNDTQT
jgi:hypothetical protein